MSRDAGLRGASRAQPALPDPDHTGGGNIDLLTNHPPPRDGFFTLALERIVNESGGTRRSANLMQRIIIFANGEIPSLENARLLLHPDDHVICADGGTRHALALGLTPNLVIGDMDFVDKQQWQELENAGVPIELFPRDKNETDLELALNRAIELEPQEIIIVAALGGRLDQTFGNTTLLSDARLSAVDVRLDDGVEEIFFCRDQGEVHGRSGDIVSLIPWGDPVQGVQTTGS